MDETVDGEYQNFKSKGGSYTREKFFGKIKEVYKKVEKMTDEDIENLNRGGHDPQKVFNAYNQAYIEKETNCYSSIYSKGLRNRKQQADNALTK